MALALALLTCVLALACRPTAAEELRLRRVNDHWLVIEGPFGDRRGDVRETPSGWLVIENEWGRRVGSVRPALNGDRESVACGRGHGRVDLDR